MNDTNKACFVCGLHHNEGMVIFEEFLCEPCQNEMIRTDVKDERYPFFVQQMKQIWLKKDA
jgi:hypothetical protein